MDKTTSENKIILGNFRQCRENTSLHSYHYLYPRSNYQKQVEVKAINLRDIADIERIAIRQNVIEPTFRKLFIPRYQRAKLYSIENQLNLTGHY